MTVVIDNRETRSLLKNTFVDWSDQTINARGGADVTFVRRYPPHRGHASSCIVRTTRWDMTGVTLITEGSETKL